MKILSILLCCLLLAGCAGAAASPAISPTVSTTVSTTPPEESLCIFLPNENADGFVKTTVAVQQITEAVIVEQLVGAGILPEGTRINSLEFDAGSGLLKADFNDPLRQALQTMGTAGEYMILGSVVNTFLSAFDAESMTITVDGNVLETGHSVYDQPLTVYPDCA